jgi:hypothetical protein
MSVSSQKVHFRAFDFLTQAPNGSCYPAKFYFVRFVLEEGIPHKHGFCFRPFDFENLSVFNARFARCFPTRKQKVRSRLVPTLFWLHP